MSAPRILVLGGTGFVGRQVCEQLTRLGWQISVPTRRAVNAGKVQSLPGLTVIEASVHSEADLAGLMHGHDAVVNLVAVLHGNEDRFENVHVNLPGKIASAMKKAGVQRLVHVSALGADPQGPSMYQRSKARGEAVLQAAGLQLTVLRPSVIFGAEDKFLNLFAELPATIGQTYELCGPDMLSLGELVQRAGQWAGVNHGRGRPVLGLPMWVGWLQAAAMELAPGEPLMSRDNLASMKVDNVATGLLPGLAALGITAASAAGVAPTYLGHRGPRSKLNRWRSGAGR